MLKYHTHYRHRKAEEALQAMQAARMKIRAEAEGAELEQACERLEHTEPALDISNNGSFEAEGANSEEQPGIIEETQMDAPPEPYVQSQTPTPPPSPPPLDIQYESDESECDYEFVHAHNDPPAIRLAYLNALCDHIIRKQTVRDVEISLQNTINCIRLIPNGIPPDVRPLTTLTSVRRRLGLDTSRLLRRVPVCDKCYKRYSMEDVSAAALPAICTQTQPSCTGYGLFAALNIDWFSLTQKRSSGAIYLAILNLPRHARYQVQNVILACVISGPHEPSLENLNFVLEPIVESFKKLYAGVAIKVYNENIPPTVKQPDQNIKDYHLICIEDGLDVIAIHVWMI
ncbi:hypothetical protein BN14_11092 [Rhizoctonia solani AG-1 IB]|uniref:Uncharacterized protein n=1 Tax=Thanatephorus cucumeris (strain AG1-IB / isolate 7/3/14) TaxID=1108050 RepID=M5CAA7_THACB|nr:hypothetical protein BN14_11092 [Rhizoctonia solani AG-1 IB]